MDRGYRVLRMGIHLATIVLFNPKVHKGQFHPHNLNKFVPVNKLKITNYGASLL